MATGSLLIHVYVDTIALPIEGATVHITGEATDITLLTDEFGKTKTIDLQAPDIVYSQTPQHDVRPYAVYDLRVEKEGYVTAVIHGVEVFADEESLQDVYLVTPEETEETETEITIDPPVLWDTPEIYPKDSLADGITSYVLPYIVIPDYIIVHDGAPTNTTAVNYTVPFSDYIKNVACSEIYSTWPTETIKANVHAIVSFTLNRVYTEWYLSKGFNFTITALVAYDQKYTHGRTLFASIVNVVDNYFDQYIRIGAQTYPYLAHYNDGDKTNNPGWLSQWGSKDLGDQGYNALQILQYYYGPNANVYDAPVSDTYPSSFPGYNLQLGSCGEPVQKMQNELNIIRGNYSGIPAIPQANGVFDTATQTTIRTFQNAFGLPVTGVVDFATWYKISYMYIAVGNLLRYTYE